MSTIRWVLTVGALCASASWGQSVISAKAGVINYSEGEVMTGGKLVEAKPGQFAEWKKGQELTTNAGRAEILLTPGVFLRVSEDTKLVLTDNRLSDTRIELISGSVILECAELLQDNSVTLSYNGYSMGVRKAGLYRLDADSSTAKVFEGELQVAGNGQSLLLKKGKVTQLGALLVADKFDSKTNDSFYRWAARRAEPLSIASFSGARSIYNSGNTWGYGGWFFNPYFGMFTYIPVRGYYNSPFGYRFYSPVVVNRVYENMATAAAFNPGGNNGMNNWNRDSYFDSNRGYSVSSRGNLGGFSSSSPAMSTGSAGAGAAAPSAPAAGRGDMGGGGAGRGGSAGGARGK